MLSVVIFPLAQVPNVEVPILILGFSQSLAYALIISGLIIIIIEPGHFQLPLMGGCRFDASVIITSRRYITDGCQYA